MQWLGCKTRFIVSSSDQFPQADSAPSSFRLQANGAFFVLVHVSAETVFGLPFACANQTDSSTLAMVMHSGHRGEKILKSKNIY
jgi:hypothetical protein